jgi:hypothetical protein
MCNLEDIASQCPTMDALEILCEQERRQELIVLFETLLNLRLPNGKPCLDRVDRRIFYMYIMGFSQPTIAAKVFMTQQGVLWRIKNISKKVLRCPNGHLTEWHSFLQPPQSILEANVPDVMLRWCLDAAEKAWSHSYWGKSNDRKVYKTATHCCVPEYLSESFGDNDTHCTLCGITCTYTAKH